MNREKVHARMVAINDRMFKWVDDQLMFEEETQIGEYGWLTEEMLLMLEVGGDLEDMLKIYDSFIVDNCEYCEYYNDIIHNPGMIKSSGVDRCRCCVGLNSIYGAVSNFKLKEDLS